MTTHEDIKLSATRHKLRELQERYQARLSEKPADARVHQLTLQSLKRLINQLTEELARSEAHARAS